MSEPSTTTHAVFKVLDTETTGLERDGFEPEVISYAVVEYLASRNPRSAASYQNLLCDHFIMPRGPCQPQAAGINGYTLDGWLAKGAVSFTVGHAQELYSHFDGGAIVIGSNPDFDKRRLAFECHRLGMREPSWSHRTVNTASIAALLYVDGQIGGTGLQSVTQHYGITHDAHDALGDCLAVIDVFERFYLELIQKPRVYREALQRIAHDEHFESERLELDSCVQSAVAALEFGL